MPRALQLLPFLLLSALFGAPLTGCAHRANNAAVSDPAASAESASEAVVRATAQVLDGNCNGALGTVKRTVALAITLDPANGTANRVTEANTQLLGATLGPGVSVRSSALSTAYPDALYLAAYCAVERSAVVEAELMLNQALRLMPEDPVYLNELGHIANLRKQWIVSLDLFKRATTSAQQLRAALDPVVPTWTVFGLSASALERRALRGQGFALIELGRLDEAVLIYFQVLAIDPNDQTALEEMAYINQLQRAR